MKDFLLDLVGGLLGRVIPMGGRRVGAVHTAALGLAVILACSSSESEHETVATQALAIQCDPQAPFGPITQVFPNDVLADGLSLSPDELTAYVSRLESGNYNIYMATRATTSAQFSGFTSVGTSVNTASDERAPWVSDDGLRLYFWRKGSGASDILMYSRTALGGAFDTAVALPGLNSDAGDEDPFFLNGENTIYFTSDRPTGDRDLWMATRASGTFGSHFKLPALVNTESSLEEERRPLLTPDGLTLYFKSDRLGYEQDTNGDIWIARRTATTQNFGDPELVPGLNSSGRDFPVTLSRDTCSLYFASNRDTGGGSTQAFRLYKATRGESGGSGGSGGSGTAPGCDLNAPFNPAHPAFTGTTIAHGLAFSPDGKTAFISMKTSPTEGYDIFVATRQSTSQPFGTPTRIAGIPNTIHDERSPSLSADGLRLYLTRPNQATGWEDDILVATRSTPAATQFSSEAWLPSSLNKVDRHEQDSFFLSTRNELYFATEDTPTAVRDLRVADYVNGTYTNVRNLSVNSGSEERRPVLTSDGRTLYFGSERPGIGQDTSGDIWMARRPENTETFAAPTNLYALNSSYAEFPVTLSPDGCTLYFASNRDTDHHALNYRLYQATRHTSTLPLVTTTVSIVGNGSVTTAPFQCTTSCSAQGAPDSWVSLRASGPAHWTGSCTTDGVRPNSDGILIFTNGGICTVDFTGGTGGSGGGDCGPGTVVDDGDPCTADSCVPGQGIVHETVLSCVCSNGQQDGDETGLDCGGSCPACGCVPDCSQATCQNAGDGCPNGYCPGVCDIGDTTPNAVACPVGAIALPMPDGTLQCRDPKCALATLKPPLCGHPGADCGDVCPTCIPQCDGRQCGSDPNCGEPCGTCTGGTYCNGAGQCVAPTVDPPPQVPCGTGGALCAVPRLARPEASGAGAVDGQFSVSEHGTAVYTVPITVPPGRAGLEPVLSLRYSGTRAPGESGVGWQINGLSHINRCPRTYALDGYAAPIKNTNDDALCIDGKRLDEIDGTIGGPDAGVKEYRTIIASFSRIVAYSDSGAGLQLSGAAPVPRTQQGPDYFKVWTKDGRILTYGRTLDSLVLGRDGIRRSWLLNRIEDRSTNNIVINYEALPSTLPSNLATTLPVVVRPSTISYTGHGEAAGNRKVQFFYEERTDPSLRFVQGGIATMMTQRLKRITTSVNGDAVRTYWLTYRAQEVSQVEQIHECQREEDPLQASTGCKRPTVFTYEEESGFEHVEGQPGINPAVQLDANGDGFPDFMRRRIEVDGIPANPELATWNVMADVAVRGTSIAVGGPVGAAISFLYTPIRTMFLGAAEYPDIDIDNWLSLGNGSRGQAPMASEQLSITDCSLGKAAYFFDYDRDGRDDWGTYCEYPSNEAILYIRKSPAATPWTFSQGLDINLPPLLEGSPHHPPPLLYDIDGDSLQDIISCKDRQTVQLRRRSRPDANGFEAPIEKTATGLDPLIYCDGSQGQTTTNPRGAHNVFDIDGDGVQDLVVADPTTGLWYVLRYTRVGTTQQIQWAPVSFDSVDDSATGRNLILVDLNGDGLQDVFKQVGDRADVWLNTGNSAFAYRSTNRPLPGSTQGCNHFRRVAPFDYDGDGRTDLVENWACGDGDSWYNVALKPNAQVTAFEAVNVTDVTERIGGTSQYRDSPFDGFADLDADGNGDLFNDREVWYGKGAKNTLLRKVVDGVGKVVNVHYGRITSDCAGSTTTWPDMCLRNVAGLVTSHEEGFLDASGVEVPEKSYGYGYRNPRVSVTGHGWIGFDSRIIVETAHIPGTTISNTVRETSIEFEPVRYETLDSPDGTLRHLYLFAGLPKKVTVVQPAGDPATPPLQSAPFDRITTIENFWERQTSESFPFPALVGRVTELLERERSGPFPGGPPEHQPLLLSRCEDGFGVDAYGNIASHSRSCGAGHFEESVGPYVDDAASRAAWLVSMRDYADTTTERNGQSKSQHWDYSYDALGRLEIVERATTARPNEFHHTQYFPNAYGNVTSVLEWADAGAQRLTTIAFDADQVYPTAITRGAAPHVTQLSYDERFGEVVTVIDPNNVVTQRAFDGLGVLAQVQDPFGTSDYVAQNLAQAEGDAATAAGTIHPRVRVSVSRPGTGNVVTDFDVYGRVVRSITNGFEAQVVGEHVYDSRGRLVASTLPHEINSLTVPRVDYAYDNFDRLVRVQHSDGRPPQERQYAGIHSLRADRQHFLRGLACSSVPCVSEIQLTKDASGQTNVLVTDAMGSVIRSIDGNNVDTADIVTDYVYGPYEQLRRASYLDNVTSTGLLLTQLTYDDYGRPLTHYDHETGLTTTTYNGYDEVVTTLDAEGQVRTLDYDLLGRLTEATDPSGTTTWTYDQGANAVGRISETRSPSTLRNPNGVRTNYVYDSRGLLERLDYSMEGSDYSIGFEYDTLGRASRIHYPDVGAEPPVVAQYSYDPSSGVLTGLDEVGSGAVKPIWRMTAAFQGHLIRQETFGNGATTNYGYTADRYWLGAIWTTLNGQAVQDVAYTRHDNGQIFRRIRPGGDVREHEYDNLGRIQRTTDLPSGTVNDYVYDPLGNLRLRGNTSISALAGRPRLVSSVDFNTYEYDDKGNLTARTGPDIPSGTQQIAYTPFDLPQSITQADKTVDFEYTADQARAIRRDVRPDATVTHHFVSDLYRHVETDGTTFGATDESFRLYAGGRQVAEILRSSAGPSRTVYLHADHQGSVDLVSTEDGATHEQRYDVFGGPQSTGGITLRAGYTGHQHDRDLGFIDMKGRMYDPLAGRFASADPIMQAPYFSQGLNRYAYVFNDPMNLTDPSGFAAHDIYSPDPASGAFSGEYGGFGGHPGGAPSGSGAAPDTTAGTALTAVNIVVDAIRLAGLPWGSTPGYSGTLAPASNSASDTTQATQRSGSANTENNGSIGPAASPEYTNRALATGGSCVMNPQACAAAAAELLARAAAALEAAAQGAAAAAARLGRTALVLSPLSIPGDTPIVRAEEFKVPRGDVTGKEAARDVPSWAKGNRPKVGEAGKDFAKRLLDQKYGPENYPKGPGSEFNKVKKWGDRGFADP